MEYNNIIEEYWEEYGDPETEAFVSLSMDFIDEVHDILERKGWSQKDLAKALDKSPAEVSKWLSGFHNMTFKSLAKLRVALDKDILVSETEAKKKYNAPVVMKTWGIIRQGEIKVVEFTQHENYNLKKVYKTVNG